MSNIRAHYEQSRHNLIFKESPFVKDLKLKQLQPAKEKLQREILAVKAEITRVQELKKQGIKMNGTRHTYVHLHRVKTSSIRKKRKEALFAIIFQTETAKTAPRHFTTLTAAGFRNHDW
jgi:G:T/U-mismatch repair DNA glycosylase